MTLSAKALAATLTDAPARPGFAAEAYPSTYAAVFVRNHAHEFRARTGHGSTTDWWSLDDATAALRSYSSEIGEDFDDVLVTLADAHLIELGVTHPDRILPAGASK